MQRAVEGKLAYLPHVDGLRAVAILLVVAYHAWPQVAPGGFIGVDVFFVISGFIITRQIWDELERGRFSFVAFLGRRLRRLLPAANVCFFITTIAAISILDPVALQAFGKSLLSAYGLVANVYFYRTSGYFEASSSEKPLLHTWSLSVEDQFYLTWPLLLMLLLWLLSSRKQVLAVVALIAALSLYYAQAVVVKDHDYAFYGLLPRAFELLLGCGVAIAAALGLNARGALSALQMPAMVVIVGSTVLLSDASSVPGLSVVPCCLAAVSLVLGGGRNRFGVVSLLSSKPAVLLGRMSYSLYLYHWPILALTTYQLGRAPNAAEATALVAVSIASAAASWLLVEQRLTVAMKLREAGMARLLGLAAGTGLAMCLAAVAMIVGKGWPGRFDAATAGVYASALTSNPLRKKCDGYENALVRSDECTFGSKPDGRPFDIAVFGDSNADHFVPAIEQWAEKTQLSGRQVTQSACAPLIGADKFRRANERETCAKYQESVLAFLDQNPNLKFAVIAAAWGGYQGALNLNTIAERLDYGAAGDADTFANALDRTIKLLRDRGIRVIVIGQIPALDAFSLPCFARAARTMTYDGECATSRARAERRLAESQSKFAAAALAHDNVRFIDMIELLCSKAFCSGFKDGRFLYRDAGHLNGDAARALAGYVKFQ